VTSQDPEPTWLRREQSYRCTIIPGGDPTQSRADVEMTNLVVEAAKPLGIALADAKVNFATIRAVSKPSQTISQPRARPG
jgi:hypothetical protein